MQATLSSTLPLHRDKGYGLDLGKTNWRTLATGHEPNGGRSSSFRCLEQLLDCDFRDRGFLPGAAVLAIPGTEVDGKIQPTQLPWSPFTVGELEEKYGTKFEIINDLQAAQIGATYEDHGRLTELYIGGEFNPNRHLCVLTLSSGINWCTGTNTTSLPLAREGGHISLAVPTKGRIADLVAFVTDCMHARASIEDLLSGSRGVEYIIDYLLHSGLYLTNKYRADLNEARESGGVGSLMTHGAVSGNPIWGQAALLFGELLGYLINQIVVSDLVGDFYIQGAVLNDTPGFAEWLFEYSPVRDVMVSKGMKMSHVARELRIYGVPSDINMATRGAERRAHSQLD
jgi:glucokinase